MEQETDAVSLHPDVIFLDQNVFSERQCPSLWNRQIINLNI